MSSYASVPKQTKTNNTKTPAETERSHPHHVKHSSFVSGHEGFKLSRSASGVTSQPEGLCGKVVVQVSGLQGESSVFDSSNLTTGVK